jgi:hypothetical protein
MGDAGAFVRAFVSEWGRPPDVVAWYALAAGAALVALAFAPRSVHAALFPSLSRRAFLTFTGFAAAALSLAYVAWYLRGGPRIIDATSYFLQGRALSEGHVAWNVPDPSASFRGRFLLFRDGEPGRMAGIFPPGYPALLALGFLVGAPMVIGPMLAAGIALATYALARELALEAKLDTNRTGQVARAAALLSLVCAALRYHTADTMAHGASALGITLAATAALYARRTDARPFFFLAGLATGYVAATRFASALPIGAVVMALAWGAPKHPASGRTWPIAAVVTGALPGIALLLLAQWASTGDALASTQRTYYAMSDGPEGCFRYGFGAGVGCLYEHGDFVRARLANGFDAIAAAGATLRRLRMHLADVANLEPLALLVLVPLSQKTRGARTCIALVAGQVLAYAPFYFDGNYPGGGARFFADVLPVEHALIALALTMVLPRVALDRKALGALGLACVGFAVHASRGHVALAERDGGRPMFEPDLLAEARITRGLVFFETDHGFNLAHDPRGASDLRASDHVVAARLLGDDHDRALAEQLGHPPSYVYRFRAAPYASVADLTKPAASVGAIEPWSPPPRDRAAMDTWRFESEHDWPPLAQSGGWAEPVWMSGSCASGGRALALHAEASGARVRIALPVPHAAAWSITPRIVRSEGDAAGTVRLVTNARGERRERAAWSWPANAPSPTGAPVWCLDLEPREIPLDPADHAEIELELTGPSAKLPALDRTTLTGPPLPAQTR